MPDTSVKYLHSGMTGAPVISGSAGAMVAVLDACLVNGFGLVTLDSLVVTSNVAVATKSGHPAEVGAVITIAGATPSGLNGEQKVTAVSGATFSFATTGITDQTATGTVTAKLAPAGWAKTYSDTDQRARDRLRDDERCRYRYACVSERHATAGRQLLDQEHGRRWRGAAMDAGGMLAADGVFFYFARTINIASYSFANELSAFGDMVPVKSGDAYACMLSGFTAAQTEPSAADNLWYSTATATELYAARSYTGLGASVPMSKRMLSLFNGVEWISGRTGTPFPNQPDGGLYVEPFHGSWHALFAGCRARLLRLPAGGAGRAVRHPGQCDGRYRIAG